MSCIQPLQAHRSHGQVSVFSFNNPAASARRSQDPVGWFDLPCGQCLECRLQYAREWTLRMQVEANEYPDNEVWFVTWTYNDSYLPVVQQESGDYVATLNVDDIQRLHKRMRKRFGPFRFFLAGEYGDDKFRPHYHGIYFGLKLDDLYFWQRTKYGNYFRSPSLERCWSNRYCQPFGNVVVGNAVGQTEAYVARYVTKKLTGPLGAAEYDRQGIDPPFSICSRRPGIGHVAFERDDKIGLRDKMYVSTPDGGMSLLPPRYYRNLTRAEYPQEMLLKSADYCVKNNFVKDAKQALTDAPIGAILYTSSKERERRVKMIKRGLV